MFDIQGFSIASILLLPIWRAVFVPSTLSLGVIFEGTTCFSRLRPVFCACDEISVLIESRPERCCLSRTSDLVKAAVLRQTDIWGVSPWFFAVVIHLVPYSGCRWYLL